MQIGQTIWAIDPCEMGGENALTVGKEYKITNLGVVFFSVDSDMLQSHPFRIKYFDKYFSLTPPNENDLKMELNYLKVLLPVVKEDLQISYGIVGHESTAINRFVSKVEELINSQS